MEKFRGGFVFSDAPITLSVPVSLRTLAGGRIANSIRTSDLNEQAWQVTLSLAQGDRTSNLGGIGMHPNAKVGKDEFDDLNLPRFDEYLELVHPHTEYFYPYFSRDIVTTNVTHTWKFSVESSNAAEEINLSWNNTALGTGDAALFLLDVENARVINMKELGTYSFTCSGRKEFQVFFSRNHTDMLLFDTSLLGFAYPNPSVGSTIIPFILANGNNSYSVELSVYDLTGKKSRGLIADQMLPGYHEVRWDGTEDNGNVVSSGVYVYRLVVNGKSYARRLIIR